MTTLQKPPVRLSSTSCRAGALSSKTIVSITTISHDPLAGMTSRFRD